VHPAPAAKRRPSYLWYARAVKMQRADRHTPTPAKGPHRAPRAEFVRTLVILFVLICHLGLSFDALATGPGFGTEAHDHAERAAGGEGPLAHEHHGCDHGCHAPAHLLGVIPHRPSLHQPSDRPLHRPHRDLAYTHLKAADQTAQVFPVRRNRSLPGDPGSYQSARNGSHRACIQSLPRPSGR